MELSHFRKLARLALATTSLFLVLACGENSCSCAAPAERPLGDESRVYDAAQIRLTPAAFDFIEANLSQLISSFLKDGLVFTIPHSRQEYSVLFVPITIHICRDGCPLTIDVIPGSARTARIPPDTLALDAQVNLSGTIKLSGDLTCDVPIHVQEKPVHAELKLWIDGRDHFMSFDVTNVQATFEDRDYDITCNSWFINFIIWALHGQITNMINDQIQSQLQASIAEQVAAATCLPCTFYSAGCPEKSVCDGRVCLDGRGDCLTKPLGLAGQVDLPNLLGASRPGTSLDLLVSPGQWLDAVSDPLVPNDGVEVRLLGGAAGRRHPCTALPDPAEIPSRARPPRLQFSDAVPRTGEPYMVGIGVSDAFLDWFFYNAYLSGLFCLTLDHNTSGLLSSSTFSLLLGSLNLLTGGRDVPVMVKVNPKHVPRAELGAGTFSVDEKGNRIIATPLVVLALPGLSLDFYVLLDERYARVLTLTQDVTLPFGLDFTPDNRLIPIFDDKNARVENARAENYGLLSENPEDLEKLIPMLLGLALPMLAGSIEPIQLPSVEGFAIDILAVAGDLPRPGTSYFEFLSIFGNLSLRPQPPAPRETLARLVELRLPDRSQMSIATEGAPLFPEVVLHVGSNRGSQAEYSCRVDGGFWRPFATGPVLKIQDPLLTLVGRHLIEVRARTIGDYRSLDPTPAALVVETPSPASDQNRSADEDEEAQTPGRIGCGTSGVARPLSLVALLGLLLLWSRRKS